MSERKTIRCKYYNFSGDYSAGKYYLLQELCKFLSCINRTESELQEAFSASHITNEYDYL